MKLLDQVRDMMRKKHYSIRAEQADVNWISKYILFNRKCHPKDMGDMGEKEIIVFLYKDVVRIEMGDFGGES